jgi:NhaA family Na+:H+ antiporter
LLALVGRRVPFGLKVVLTALAVVHNVGAGVGLALFNTHAINWLAIAIAAAFLIALAVANRAGIRHPVVYVGLALGVWAGVLASGVHATVAGVLVAMLVPVRPRLHPREFLDLSEDRLSRLRTGRLTADRLLEDRWQLDAISDLRRIASEMRPPGLALEETFHGFVAYTILPLFAFFNAGVSVGFTGALMHPIGLGIVVGLVAGKMVGITLFTWAAVVVGGAERPDDVSWSQVYGGSCLAGIGFTMSMFVTQLAFSTPENLARAKVGILAASILAAVLGAIVLHVRLPRLRNAEQNAATSSHP